MSGGPKEEEGEGEETGEVCHPGSQTDPALAPLASAQSPSMLPICPTHTHTHKTLKSLPPSCLNFPTHLPQLGDLVWLGWKRTPDKESWERRRGLSWAHKSLRS